jgi:hypothetical protein
MASSNVAALLAKEFVAVRLDLDRGTGAKEIESRFTDQEQGLPWFAFVDPATGRAATTSTGPKGNVGFPWEPHEIAHFKTMLETSKRHLTGNDIAALVTSLEEFRKAQEGK